jgi:hypothetical protein
VGRNGEPLSVVPLSTSRTTGPPITWNRDATPLFA